MRGQLRGGYHCEAGATRLRAGHLHDVAALWKEQGCAASERDP